MESMSRQRLLSPDGPLARARVSRGAQQGTQRFTSPLYTPSGFSYATTMQECHHDPGDCPYDFAMRGDSHPIIPSYGYPCIGPVSIDFLANVSACFRVR